MQVHLSRNNIPIVKSSPKHTSLPFSQHILWRCCNHPGIPSSMAEILLFNSVFHDGVTSVSVSTLKPLLRVICCSNYSSLKDKWSYNEQNSPMGYQVKSGGITRELDKELSLYYPLYIYMAPGPCYNNIYLALKSMLLPHVLLLIYMCFP